jgi:hypothetical protein
VDLPDDERSSPRAIARVTNPSRLYGLRSRRLRRVGHHLRGRVPKRSVEQVCPTCGYLSR